MGVLAMVAPGSRMPSPEAVRWAAEQTIRMHAEPVHPYVESRCQQCPDADPLNCPQLRWARTYVAMHVEA